jgi:F-type H+-transporting ATPase subunit c
MDKVSLALVCFSAAISIGLPGFAAALSMGRGIESACSGIARNPEAKGPITTTMIIGMALIESIAIYGLVIAIILLFVNPLSV